MSNYSLFDLLQVYETEFFVRYKSFTLAIHEIVETEDCISYSGRSYEPHYLWRQEGIEGFFRVVDSYRKKFEEIKHRAENDIEEDLDWYLLNEEYPELVANLLDNLQEFIDYQSTKLAKEELPNQNAEIKLTHINEVDSDYEHFYTLQSLLE